MSLHSHRCVACGGPVPCLHDRLADPDPQTGRISQDCPIARGDEPALCETCDLTRLLAISSCSNCHGTGKLPVRECPACDGTGVGIH